MSHTLPAGTTLDISFTLSLPADASREEVMDWLRFELGATGRLAIRNSLAKHEIEDGRAQDVRVVVWERAEAEHV